MENKTTISEITELKNKAHKLVIQLLPPETHKESTEAKLLYDHIEDLGNRSVFVIDQRNQLIKVIDSWKKEEEINNEHVANLNKEIENLKKELEQAISDCKFHDDENKEFKAALINADIVIQQLKEEKEAVELLLEENKKRSQEWCDKAMEAGAERNALNNQLKEALDAGSLIEELEPRVENLTDALQELFEALVKSGDDININTELKNRIQLLLKIETKTSTHNLAEEKTGQAIFTCCSNCETPVGCSATKVCVLI